MKKEDYMERTLVLVKPDGVERALIGKVIGTFEEAGLKVVAMKMVKVTKEFVGKHYIVDKVWMENMGKKTIASYEAKGLKMNETPLEIGTRVRGYLLEYLSENPVVAIVVEGSDAVSIVIKLAGSTEPRKAEPSTIRGRYSSDSNSLADEQKRAARNVIHISDSKESAEKEIRLWFKESEIFGYKRADEGAMFLQ